MFLAPNFWRAAKCSSRKAFSNTGQTPAATKRSGLNYWALKCPNEHEYLATSPSAVCADCGEQPAEPGQMLMFPRFGYTTAAWDPPKAPGRRLDRIGEVVVIALDGFSTREATQTIQNFAGVQGLDGNVLRSRTRGTVAAERWRSGRRP